MATNPESPLDVLWKEYSLVFRDFDDMTLARWLAQTLGQLEGKAWRLSHPLLGAYRLGAQLAHDRQIWFKRLATPPAAYAESACCRAPMLPLLTRDVRDAGTHPLLHDQYFTSGSFISFPLVYHGELVGVVNLTNRAQSAAYTQEDVERVRLLALVIALVATHARLPERLLDVIAVA